jgi:rubrerythrin
MAGCTPVMSEALLKKILEGSIRIEEESYALYVRAQGIAKLPSSKALLSELADDELTHKEKLVAIMEKSESVYWAGVSELGSETGEIEDLKIVDYMPDVTLSEDADYPTMLVYAGKREKMTHEHYTSLARGPFARYFPQAGELFSKLAEEELVHKNKIEREYAERVLKKA